MLAELVCADLGICLPNVSAAITIVALAPRSQSASPECSARIPRQPTSWQDFRFRLRGARHRSPTALSPLLPRGLSCTSMALLRDHGTIAQSTPPKVSKKSKHNEMQKNISKYECVLSHSAVREYQIRVWRIVRMHITFKVELELQRCLQSGFKAKVCFDILFLICWLSALRAPRRGHTNAALAEPATPESAFCTQLCCGVPCCHHAYMYSA